MLARLRAVDPDAAGRLHLSDRKRIIRALEVYLETGETITEHNRKTQAVPPRYSPDLAGAGLCPAGRAVPPYRSAGRSHACSRGWWRKFRGFSPTAFPKRPPPCRPSATRNSWTLLTAACTIEEAADLVRQSSRRYAKRQLTWFRRNKAIHWLIREAGDTGREILENAATGL